MTPYFADDWLTIYQGDARDVLPTLPGDSVDCIVTSPPYWGLRDYGTASWSGGIEDCDHVEMAVGMSSRNTLGPNGHLPSTNAANVGRTRQYALTCGRCGATRQDSQLGLEATPEEYVANLVAVFRELRRILKPTGTCFLNIGDSFLPGKQMAGVPWRVAFALQADGWYLRSDIIWAKPNPMPESVTDRPTKAHEYLFLLTKSARYFYDADAVREAATWGEWNSAKSFSPNGRMARDGVGVAGGEQWNGTGTHEDVNKSGRNLRSVWTIATRPYPGAHFAVFPPELPERCIKAGSSERGVCPKCGAPWERVVERTVTGVRHVSPKDANPNRNDGPDEPTSRLHSQYFDDRRETTGWQPTCSHNERGGTEVHVPPAWPVPAVILDCFAGSGTTGMVANRLSRRAILIDLNADYLRQQMARNAQTPLGLGA